MLLKLSTALRSGDYYMFEELDDKLELDLFNKTQPDDFVEDTTDAKYAHKKKMSEVRKLYKILTQIVFFRTFDFELKNTDIFLYGSIEWICNSTN